MKQRLCLVFELFSLEETSTGYIMEEMANTLSNKYKVTVVCGLSI